MVSHIPIKLPVQVHCVFVIQPTIVFSQRSAMRVEREEKERTLFIANGTICAYLDQSNKKILIAIGDAARCIYLVIRSMRSAGELFESDVWTWRGKQKSPTNNVVTRVDSTKGQWSKWSLTTMHAHYAALKGPLCILNPIGAQLRLKFFFRNFENVKMAHLTASPSTTKLVVGNQTVCGVCKCVLAFKHPTLECISISSGGTHTTATAADFPFCQTLHRPQSSSFPFHENICLRVHSNERETVFKIIIWQHCDWLTVVCREKFPIFVVFHCDSCHLFGITMCEIEEVNWNGLYVWNFIKFHANRMKTKQSRFFLLAK